MQMLEIKFDMKDNESGQRKIKMLQEELIELRS
jgi:hypothetical protein